MSIQVANVSLASALVGQTGELVSFGNLLPPPTIAQQMRPSAAEDVPHLVIFNESGCLLKISMPESAQSKTLPAGRWLDIPIPPHESAVNYQVDAIATGGAFSNLLADYFLPGEPVDALGTLGNSPIQGTVTMANNPIILSTPVKVTGRTSTAQLNSAVGLAPADRDTLIYIVSYLDIENGVSGNALTWGVQYTCATDGLLHTETLMVVQQSTNTIVALDGVAVRANGRYNGVSQGIWAKAGTAIFVVFRDPTNTPNDSFAASAIVADF